MYISRAASSGLLVGYNYARHPQMPTLSDEDQKYYYAAYSKGEYENRNDEEGTCHGCVIPVKSKEQDTRRSRYDSPPDPPPFHHRPDHDVESFFWVLLATLLRAQPRDTNDDPNRKHYWGAYNVLLQHSIGKGNIFDSRSQLLQLGLRTFRAFLHPNLQSLAPMLCAMADQIEPEYGLFDHPPAPDHLHEAMRRLLLEQILEMHKANEPIYLSPGCQRPLKGEE